MPSIPVFFLAQLAIMGLPDLARPHATNIAASVAYVMMTPCYLWIRWQRYHLYRHRIDCAYLVAIPLAVTLQILIPYPFGNISGIMLICMTAVVHAIFLRWIRRTPTVPDVHQKNEDSLIKIIA